ncbi:MAG: hypothetical protein WAR41_06150 [Azonexus sp.]
MPSRWLAAQAVASWALDAGPEHSRDIDVFQDGERHDFEFTS